MKTVLIWVGKTQFSYINKATDDYLGRIKHYMSTELLEIPDVKSSLRRTLEDQRTNEGLAILKKIEKEDYVVLLDDKGKTFTSIEFAQWINQRQLSFVNRLVFVIGGAYGFSPEVYARCNAQLSLSKMTFSHQIIRAIFSEQLYRAMTILKGEPYHHE